MSGPDSDPASWIGEHGPKLLAYARQWTGSHADAEDVFQEAFVRFWRSRESARDPLTYLFRCVRNTAMNWRRSRRRRQRLEQRTPARQGASDPALPVARAERRRAIEGALARLPLDQREVVAMSIWGEMTFREIGQVMAIPASTAHWKYRTAMGTLHDELGDERQT